MSDSHLPPLAWSFCSTSIAFSTAEAGDQRDPLLRAAWLPTVGCHLPCRLPVQVHGAVIADADDPQADLAGADGLVSRDPGLALGVFGADCPGLVVTAPDVLGVAHCGWRGTAAGIVTALIQAVATRSQQPMSRWQAVIGPGISGPRYEVDGPVLAARAWPEGSLSAVVSDRAHLDLSTAIAADCDAAGIGLVARIGICTAGDPRLHSFRHQGPGLVQLLVAWRIPVP